MHTRLLLCLAVLSLAACTPAAPPPEANTGVSSSIVTPASSDSSAKQNAPVPGQLPLEFMPLDTITQAPTYMPSKPFACQPTYFKPQEYPETESFIIDLAGKQVRVLRTVREESDMPYAFIEYQFSTDECHSRALQVVKNGQTYALYTHIQDEQMGSPGWNVGPQQKYLMIHNRHLEQGKWIEEARRIELETKQATLFTLDDCFTYGYPLADGSIISNYMKPIEHSPTVFCSVDPNGVPLVKVHPVGKEGMSLANPFVDTEHHLFVATDINNCVTGSCDGEDNTLIVVNLLNPREWVLLHMKMPDDPTACLFNGEDNPEFSFSMFSFQNPDVRFRYKRYKDGCVTAAEGGTWEWSNWVQTGPVRTDYVARPDWYEAQVVQTGGLESQNVTKSAWVQTDALFDDAMTESLVSVEFNSPGHIMWTRCAEGYILKGCKSSTSKRAGQSGDPDCGIILSDMDKNIVTIACSLR